MKKIVLISIFYLAHIPFVMASEWQLATHKNNIKIYTKQSSGSAIQSLKAEGIVNASVENVTAILRDVEHANKWLPRLDERSYVKNISDIEAVLYDVNEMPWPVRDREMVVHHKLELAEDRKSLILKFNSVVDPSKPPHKERVRAVIHYGRLRFSPINDTQTLIELEILVDPMGSIPKWVVNILQISMPFEFIDSLNKFASKTTLTPLPGIQGLINKLKRDYK